MASASVDYTRRVGRNIPALDGVRGFALILVFLVHFALYLGLTQDTRVDRVVYRVCLGGWCAVDMFFVLSGFLITGILLDTKGSAHTLRNFYARRCIRVFPPYYIFLALYFFVGPALVPPHFVPPEYAAQAWYWTYLTNVRVAIYGWTDPGLTHFWSLAVEEQFYLVWPFVVLAIDRTTLKRFCIGLMVLAPLLRVLCFVLRQHEAAYTLTPCRMDSLAAGAIVAVLVREGLPAETLLRWAKWCAIVGGAGIAAIILKRGHFTHFDPAVFTIGMTFVALLVGGVIATIVVADGSRTERFFDTWLFRTLGKFSYGIYIIHVPLLCLMAVTGLDLRHAHRIGGSLTPMLLFYLVVAGGFMVLCGAASWHIYEKRLLKLKRFFG